MPCKVYRGLTLIELVIVLAIIMILAALVFPVFSAAMGHLRRSSCATNLHQVLQAVEFANQEGSAYPSFPNYAGNEGVPLGGVSGVSHTEKNPAKSYLWCADDQFPKHFPDDMWRVPADRKANGLQRDLTGSSYDFGYNYYGYVTTTEGLPFPVTTPEAAKYFFEDPKLVDSSFPTPLGDPDYPHWSMGLLDTASVTRNGITKNFLRAHGLFQGLWNTWAPQNTIVTFCPNHMNARLLIAGMLDGSTQLIRPVQPMINEDSPLVWSGIYSRKNDPGGYIAPIDWRVNKAAFSSDFSKTSKLFGDAPGNALAQNMPVVQVVSFNLVSSNFSTANPWWVVSNVHIQPHDLIMVISHTKWQWSDFSIDAYDTEMQASYIKLLDQSGKVLFTADGDPVEAAGGETPGLVLPRQGNSKNPMGMLIGKIEGSNDIFPLGSRGSYLVPDGGPSGNLCLTMNNTAAELGKIDGWCEVWVAIFSPGG